MMLLYGLVSLALALAGYAQSKRILNPLTIFSTVWGGIVLLYNLRLSGWQEKIADETYLVLLASLGAFAFAYTLCVFFKFKTRIKRVDRFSPTYKTVQALFIFWGIVECLEIAWSGGIPILWYLLGSGKTYFDFGIPSLHGFMNSIGLVIIALATYLMCRDDENRLRLLGIACFVGIFYLCLITRQVVVSALVETIMILILSNVRIRISRIIFGSVAFIIIFGLVGDFRTGYESFIYVSRLDTEIHPFFVGLYWVYMYLTMTIANINNAVLLNYSGFGFGALSTFIPTVLSALANVEPIDGLGYLVTDSYNVSGFFSHFYVGFGTMGVMFVSALYGVVSGTIFKGVLELPDFRNTLLYAVVCQILLLSFFFNMLLYLPSGFQLIVILFLFRRDRYDLTSTAVPCKTNGNAGEELTCRTM